MMSPWNHRGKEGEGDSPLPRTGDQPVSTADIPPVPEHARERQLLKAIDLRKPVIFAYTFSRARP